MKNLFKIRDNFRQELWLLLLIALLTSAIAFYLPSFVSPTNLSLMLDDNAVLLLLACGQMTVLITRGVDLSIAANIAFTGMVSAQFNHAWPDAGVLPVLILSGVIGTALGMLNGLLVWLLEVPPIVATLGTMSIYRGSVFIISQGRWVNSSQMSPEFLHFVAHRILGLTALSWVAIAGVLATAALLHLTNIGRNLYAVGDNPSSAAYAGLSVGRSQCAAFTLSGLLAGLCGYFWVARFGVAYTDVALGFELQVIAACVIGGVSIAGGMGSVTGIVLGCAFLGAIKTALPMLGFSPFWQMAVSGMIITISVVLNTRDQRTTDQKILTETSLPEMQT